MADLGAILAANRAAVESLIVAAEQSPGTWRTPRAAGKWSPAQIVEHVARALDESANMVAGRPTKFPRFPFILRPVARALFFNRVLRNQAFPNAKTNKPLDPAFGDDRSPATPAEGRARLDRAVASFDQACLVASGPTVKSSAFGTVRLTDYAQFQVLQATHHETQLKTNP